MHATVSGLAEYLAEDDADGTAHRARDHGHPALERAAAAAADAGPRRAALSAADELLGVVPVDYRKPFDMREVIARIVDDSDFLDFKPLYGPHTVCGQAAIEGDARRHHQQQRPHRRRPAPTRPRTSSSPAARPDMPIVFLQNTTGYMVGSDAEQRRHRSSTAPR